MPSIFDSEVLRIERERNKEIIDRLSGVSSIQQQFDRLSHLFDSSYRSLNSIIDQKLLVSDANSALLQRTLIGKTTQLDTITEYLNRFQNRELQEFWQSRYRSDSIAQTCVARIESQLDSIFNSKLFRSAIGGFGQNLGTQLLTQRNFAQTHAEILQSQLDSTFSSNLMRSVFGNLNRVEDSQFQGWIDELEETDFSWNDDGTVDVDSDSVDVADLEHVFKEIPNSEKSLGQWVQNLSKLAPPLRKAALFMLTNLGNIVCSIVAAVIMMQPEFHSWVSETAGLKPREATKYVCKEIANTYGSELLPQRRVVSIRTLNVRVGPGRRFERIDQLMLGKVVVVTNKKRAWTEIKYLDHELNEFHTGWVFSRYLKRIYY